MLRNLNILWLIFGACILNAQNMTAEQLIQKWKVKDITQTIEAEKTFSDLKYNYNPKVYDKVITQINEYLVKEQDTRIQIRLMMYETLKDLELSNGKLTPEREKKLTSYFQKAASIKDNQILSELYSLYAENSNASFEDNLFYILKTIEIQEEIGTQYFPKFYMRMFFAGLSYYNLSLYKESIHFSKKSIENLKSPQENLGIYVLNMDLMGTSYFRLEKNDSSRYCYDKIYKELRNYNLNQDNYNEGFKIYKSSFFNIWLGISQGGIGRVLISEKKYEEAIPYLDYNIAQSKTHDQLNDLAKAENLLAEAYTHLNQNQKAFALRKNALNNALKSNTVREIISATKGLEQYFKQSGRYDSAYYYNEKKHFYETQVNKAINQSKFLSVTNRLQHEKMQQTIAEAESRINQQTMTRNYILAISALLITILFFFYYRFRQQQQIKMLRLNKKKETAEKNYKESQKIIQEANELLAQFRHRLKQNNTLIETLKNGESNKTPNYSELQSTTILTKDDWLNFRKEFDKVYPNYYYSLREVYPQLSPAEIRYLCLVKLNLRQNEIAAALGISDSSVRVTWHRMRKKLGVEKTINPDDFLKKFEKKQELIYTNTTNSKRDT